VKVDFPLKISSTFGSSITLGAGSTVETGTSFGGSCLTFDFGLKLALVDFNCLVELTLSFCLVSSYSGVSTFY